MKHTASARGCFRQNSMNHISNANGQRRTDETAQEEIEMKYLKRATAQLRRAGIENIVIRKCLWGYVPHNPTLRGTITATVKRTAAECVESVINGSNLPLQVTPTPAAYNANDL